MQRAQSREPSANFPLFPKLSGDILYFIAEFSSFKTRASLVRCNKLLHATCMPLLFRDIYIYTPTKLVRLYESPKALNMLSGTRSLFLGEELFYHTSWDSSWEVLEHDKSDYVIFILSATTSLLRLQLVPLDHWISRAGTDQVPYLVQRLRSLSSDPRFLPKLEVIVGAEGISLGFLCKIRPVKYLSDLTSRGMNVEVYLEHTEPPLLSSPSTRPGPAYSLSPREIGLLVHESKGTHLTEYPFIHLTIRPLPVIHDLFSWIREMVLAAGLPSDHLGSLDLTFDPKPPFMPAQEQFKVVEGLHKMLPTLEKATISNPPIRWYLTPERAYLTGPYSTFYAPEILPKWTPAPDSDKTDPEVIRWWLDLLRLNRPDMPGYDRREAGQNARRLISAMRLRWTDSSVPHEWWVEDYLRGGRN